ncbi:phosphatidate cytidylyltransferase [Anopheles sinensis]|uniref:Phosphatidate cytidylyltransferase n=1 Tax=Anopheles sinensis TaxID=74873 RepID=A0A084V9W2_ANOSI|nr:phosphatidate cytidylyltransferase [Anopheles sinensis]
MLRFPPGNKSARQRMDFNKIDGIDGDSTIRSNRTTVDEESSPCVPSLPVPERPVPFSAHLSDVASEWSPHERSDIEDLEQVRYPIKSSLSAVNCAKKA